MCSRNPFALMLLGLLAGFSASAQAGRDSATKHKHQRGAAREMGAGAGDVGVGAAKGTGDVAKGAGKGAADLVTLHPIDAGGSIVKGAGSAGKDVTVGTAKGAGKVTKGVGRAFKHLF